MAAGGGGGVLKKYVSMWYISTANPEDNDVRQASSKHQASSIQHLHAQAVHHAPSSL